MIFKDRPRVFCADFFLGSDILPPLKSYKLLMEDLKSMFSKWHVSEQEKSKRLPKVVHANPLVAWAKQNNISLTGVGKVVPVDPL